jgi:hypothetical protein
MMRRTSGQRRITSGERRGGRQDEERRTSGERRGERQDEENRD